MLLLWIGATIMGVLVLGTIVYLMLLESEQ